MPLISRAGAGMDSDALLAEALRRIRRLEKRPHGYFDAGVVASATSVSTSYSTLLTTSSLVSGVWLLTASMTIDEPTAPSPSTNYVTVRSIAGSATATFLGQSAIESVVPLPNATDNEISLGFTTLVRITAAGTLLIQVKASNLGIQVQDVPFSGGTESASGYTAVLIA